MTLMRTFDFWGSGSVTARTSMNDGFYDLISVKAGTPCVVIEEETTFDTGFWRVLFPCGILWVHTFFLEEVVT